MNKFYSFLVAIVFAVFMIGCDDAFVKTSYSTLAATGATYNAIMLSASDAYDAKIIGEKEKLMIIDAGNVFYGSYQAATKALEIYVKAEESGDATLKGISAQAISTCITDLNDFIKIYNSISDGVSGMQKWNEYKEVN